MEKHEAYSVLIIDNNGRRGTGTLFYTKGASSFFIFTCAHVIYTSKEVRIHILIPNGSNLEERVVVANRNQFHFSPIDSPIVIGAESEHTCDVAIIESAKENLFLEPTSYAICPMSYNERVVALGYPFSTAKSVYYQQDELFAKVIRFQNDQDYFIIRVEDGFLNASDRESELKGFSGSPVWDEENLNKSIYLFGGIITRGVGNNISRARINVMNARLFRSLMFDEFGVSIETRLPFIPEKDVAPSYIVDEESPDQIVVRAGWLENERKKAHTYIDNLQLKKTIVIARDAINNSEFSKCTKSQKASIYDILKEAYRLAREYDIYDKICEEMHQLDIYGEEDDLATANRYFEALDNEKAEEYINKALLKNPNGNRERILALVIRVSKDKNAELSSLSEFLGAGDQLLIQPEDKFEEEYIYHMLGFILSNRFRETGRAIRCLNRAYQISGSYVILETLGITYYLNSIKAAFIEDGKDLIDPFKIDSGEIDKARQAFLSVFSAADELWMKGTFKRAGLHVFKCFYFIKDNFRILKHYHEVIKYYEFPNLETKRDVQICYLDVAIKVGPLNLEDFDALTEHDKKFYELALILEKTMKLFNGGLVVPAPVKEEDLFSMIADGENRLHNLIATQKDKRLSFDGLHTVFINLYGNCIMRYKWNAIMEVKRHFAAIKNHLGIDAIIIYIKELQIDCFEDIEKQYIDFFNKHNDVISFMELANFYIRQGKFDKAKNLYDSVFSERQYLIKTQAEYFYRMYIMFTLEHRLDLTPAIRCFVEHKKEFKDFFVALAIEKNLKFATCTFNEPDQMLEDNKLVFEEGFISEFEYMENCLIINMLNCRPEVAEKYSRWTPSLNPLLPTIYQQMLFSWKFGQVVPNKHWDSMQKWNYNQVNAKYNEESWLLDYKDILKKSGTAYNKVIVVDLWTLYYIVKMELINILSMFKTVYVTHSTVSSALQEITNVNDNAIRSVLDLLKDKRNIKILSPTLEQQLTINNSEFKYFEINYACLLAKELNCPALVGEFRFPILTQLQSKVIRPCNINNIIDFINMGLN